MKLHDSLDNYIQMHRQQVGLSQDELKHLISVESRETITKYELGARYPTLETLLALEMVIGEPIQTIFAGVAKRVRRSVKERAEVLLTSLHGQPKQRIAEKYDVLFDLANPDDIHVIPTWGDQS